jgi:UDP-glucose 4-epimerase
MNWLVTGGAGYIGAHVTRSLLRDGYRVSILDDFSTGKRTRIPAGVVTHNCSILDTEKMVDIFSKTHFDGVIHLAAKKSVAESFLYNDEYFQINNDGSLNVARVAQMFSVSRMIFASTAAVYAPPVLNAPLKEDAKLGPISPYGKSKLSAEQSLTELSNNGGLELIILRFFNVVGSLSSDLAEENAPNIFPTLEQCIREDKVFEIFGNDYETADGTAIRDYIHVVDISDAFIKLVEGFDGLAKNGPLILNLGTGKGKSVLEIISGFQDDVGKDLLIDYRDRRSGDLPYMVCDPRKAMEILGWQAKKNLFGN